MKINLTKITFKPSIAGPEITQDLHKDIAEVIYQNAHTLAAHSFALKLYEADGDLEASEEDIKHIKAVLPNFVYFVQEGVLKALGE